MFIKVQFSEDSVLQHSVCSLFDSPLCCCITSLLLHTPPHLLHVVLSWQMLQGSGAYRSLTCTYVPLPPQTDTRPRGLTRHWNAECTEDIYSNHSQREQQKQSQLSKVTVWHEVCFAPNACLAYFDSPLNYFISSLLYSTPSSSPTCLTNWPGECLVRRYFLNQLKVIWQQRRLDGWGNVSQ